MHQLVGAITANKRWQPGVLLENPQKQQQPVQKKKLQQQYSKEQVLESQSFLNPSNNILSEHEIKGIDIGKPFKRLQEEAAAIFSDIKMTLTLDSLPLFL